MTVSAESLLDAKIVPTSILKSVSDFLENFCLSFKQESVKAIAFFIKFKFCAE